MKNLIRTRRLVTSIGCMSTLLVLATIHAHAEGFISREDRPRWSMPYENFSTYDMRQYKTARTTSSTSGIRPEWHGPIDLVTFDQFGNFLLPGSNAYNLTWDMSDVGASVPTADLGRFNNVAIASDEFGNWQTKFMIAPSAGSGIRVFFTPSTVKLTNFKGIRWDASNRQNSFSVIASVGSNPGTSTTNRRDQNYHYRNMLGGHWQSVLGDIMTIGGTFAMINRQTQSYSNYDIAGEYIYGMMNKDVERYMYVVITSDSPEDETVGARVYDVIPVLDGKKVDLPKRVTKIPDVLSMVKYSGNKFSTAGINGRSDIIFASDTSGEFIGKEAHLENYIYSDESWFLDLMNSSAGGSSTSASDINNKYRQFFGKYSSSAQGYVNIINPNNPTDTNDRYFRSDPTNGYHEARGTDVIIYEFLIPAGTRKVEFMVNASNDYCIDIVACLPTMQQTAQGGSWTDDPLKWASSSWNVIYDRKNCVKAKGKVKDNSNAGWVKIAYDRITGVNVYGLNMELNWRGLQIRGEINEYNELRAYPISNLLSGESHSIETTRAWFLNGEKDFGTVSVGGEIYNYPNKYFKMSDYSVNSSSATAYWGDDLVDDNDDNNTSTGGSEYPGLNFDYDGTSGTQYVDTSFYGQPYITYYYNEISFGDDYNHNGIVDYRENDGEIDLPYDRDSSGKHFFVKYRPYLYDLITLGHYDIKQDVKGGRNLTSYAKFEHMQRINNFEYGIFHRTERVKDDYKSDFVYNQAGQDFVDWNGNFNNLLYKDSWVHTTMVSAKLNLFNNLNIVNYAKVDINHRVGDLTLPGTPEQQTINLPDVISSEQFIHKIDYTYRLADFRIIPQISWRGNRLIKEKRIREVSIIPQFKVINEYESVNFYYRDGKSHSYTYFPVLRFDYKVAPKTTLRCAFQGLPGLNEVTRNNERPLADMNRRRMILAFETNTVYSGFNLLVTSGIRRDKQTYVEPMGRRADGWTEYFITMQAESSN
jgi:hypothetical protein